ncbi:hypothetical protein Pla175_15200 [Pirellulimonas nuda]|uniref:Anti-sigma-28 factor FlgM C-terminal domain-containing protein n=1 Tax=Pirellulimonas nuda TaxID=2528009 RepID=A0A518D9I7_9BACT|nr:flagellar biosynthesis anti-sigma factor FlgM [Pirellulimonas nuda]QDU88149.1 hypothetical protein Pla175_15200 [Pirellulimonas nuda]
MNVSGPSHVHSAHGVNAPHTLRGPHRPTSAAPQTVDKLEISEAARAASQSTGVRSDLVARIRSEIASGSYETPQKIDSAVERLLDQLG